MPNVFPDDILARLRAIETGISDGDIDVEGGEIISYDSTTGIALVLFDGGDFADVTIVNTGGDMAFGVNEGPVLVDRTNGHTYRIKVTAGTLGTEVVT